MIIVQQGQYNTPWATCSRNKTLSSPTYLWTIRHKLANVAYQFIPFRILPITTYPPNYDLFELNIFSNQPTVLIGSNVQAANLPLIPGEWWLKIYEQVSTTNLNPALSYDVVYEGTLLVEQQTPIQQVEYTGTSNTWVVYQG
jgi:hypothetical protein